jgi:hypothetical protein
MDSMLGVAPLSSSHVDTIEHDDDGDSAATALRAQAIAALSHLAALPALPEATPQALMDCLAALALGAASGGLGEGSSESGRENSVHVGLQRLHMPSLSAAAAARLEKEGTVSTATGSADDDFELVASAAASVPAQYPQSMLVTSAMHTGRSALAMRQQFAAVAAAAVGVQNPSSSPAPSLLSSPVSISPSSSTLPTRVAARMALALRESTVDTREVDLMRREADLGRRLLALAGVYKAFLRKASIGEEKGNTLRNVSLICCVFCAVCSSQKSEQKRKPLQRRWCLQGRQMLMLSARRRPALLKRQLLLHGLKRSK